MLWRSWYIKNEIIHDKEPPPTEVSCRILISCLNSLEVIKESRHSDYKGKTPIAMPLNQPGMAPKSRWARPETGWVKLNCDGSFDQEGRSGSGVILRDKLGNIRFSSCRTLYNCRDSLKAELGACMKGLSLAIQRSEANCDKFSGCFEARQLCEGG